MFLIAVNVGWVVRILATPRELMYGEAAVSDVAAPTFPAGGAWRVDLDTGEQDLLNGSDFANPLGVDIAP